MTKLTFLVFFLKAPHNDCENNDDLDSIQQQAISLGKRMNKSKNAKNSKVFQTFSTYKETTNKKNEKSSSEDIVRGQESVDDNNPFSCLLQKNAIKQTKNTNTEIQISQNTSQNLLIIKLENIVSLNEKTIENITKIINDLNAILTLFNALFIFKNNNNTKILYNSQLDKTSSYNSNSYNLIIKEIIALIIILIPINKKLKKEIKRINTVLKASYLIKYKKIKSCKKEAIYPICPKTIEDLLLHNNNYIENFQTISIFLNKELCNLSETSIKNQIFYIFNQQILKKDLINYNLELITDLISNNKTIEEKLILLNKKLSELTDPQQSNNSSITTIYAMKSNNSSITTIYAMKSTQQNSSFEKKENESNNLTNSSYSMIDCLLATCDKISQTNYNDNNTQKTLSNRH